MIYENMNRREFFEKAGKGFLGGLSYFLFGELSAQEKNISEEFLDKVNENFDFLYDSFYNPKKKMIIIETISGNETYWANIPVTKKDGNFMIKPESDLELIVEGNFDGGRGKRRIVDKYNKGFDGKPDEFRPVLSISAPNMIKYNQRDARNYFEKGLGTITEYLNQIPPETSLISQ